MHAKGITGSDAVSSYHQYGGPITTSEVKCSLHRSYDIQGMEFFMREISSGKIQQFLRLGQPTKLSSDFHLLGVSCQRSQVTQSPGVSLPK